MRKGLFIECEIKKNATTERKGCLRTKVRGWRSSRGETTVQKKRGGARKGPPVRDGGYTIVEIEMVGRCVSGHPVSDCC